MLKFVEIPERPENPVLLFYGQSGSGKSLIAGGWPAGPTLVLACDPGPLGGAMSLRQLPKEQQPKVVVLRSWKEYLRLEPEIKKLVQTGEFRTIVIDSLTYLQTYIGKELLEASGREALRLDDYRLLQARTRRLVMELADLPVTTIFTCLEASERDELSGALYRAPDLIGALSREIPQYCDIVARFVPKSSFAPSGERVTRYFTYLDGDESFLAKDRTGLLPKVIELTGPSWEGFDPLITS